MFRIGHVDIARIEESLGHGFAPDFLFPTAEKDLFAGSAAALGPNFFDAGAGRLMSSIHTWLVRTGRHVILIDTCAGNHKHRPMLPRFHKLDTPFLDRLRAAGVAPEQVDYVICTHVHVDHVGWNTRLVDGRWVPAFPNAKYIIARREIDFWTAQAAAAAPDDLVAILYNDSIRPILDSGQAELVEGDHPLGDEIMLTPAPGHTPGQVIAHLRAGGRRAVFSGDVMHHPIQIGNPHVNSCFCENHDEARATRLRLLESCSETGALLLPAHFGRPHGVHIEARPGGFAFRLPA